MKTEKQIQINLFLCKSDQDPSPFAGNYQRYMGKKRKQRNSDLKDNPYRIINFRILSNPSVTARMLHRTHSSTLFNLLSHVLLP